MAERSKALVSGTSLEWGVGSNPTAAIKFNFNLSLCTVPANRECILNIEYAWGSVAEWSKALVLGTSLVRGVGSNPTAAIHFIIMCLIILLIDSGFKTM